jgi:hypothetical protein
LSHSSWLACCFWHYCSLYSSWTSVCLVWYHFCCSILDKNPTCLIVPSVSKLKTLSPLCCFKFSMVFLSSRIYSRTSSLHLNDLITISLSTVISNSSANHHLYANYRYTKPFLSSSAADVAYNISHIEHTIYKVYNWMSSNCLSVNPTKTEFLLVGLPRQLSNSVIPSFIYVIMSLCHLFILLLIKESSLIAISFCLDTILLCPNHAFIIFVSGVIVFYK